MRCSLTVEELKRYVGFQLENFMPDKYKFAGRDIDSALSEALERTEFCFKHIRHVHYFDNGEACFSHLHGDQYAQFLYFLSNSLWNISENKAICDKIIYLNRVLNNFFFSYKADLPNIFRFQHPIGTILGNANYSDFLVVLQNVTVNTDDNRGGGKPFIGKGVFLAAGATILGNTTIGDFASVSANVTLYNEHVPMNNVALTENGTQKVIRPRKHQTCMAQQYFNVNIEDYFKNT